MSKRILVSFQSSVAALVDRRILFIHAGVCEEVFQSVSEIGLDEVAAEAPEIKESHPAVLASQLKDFPLLVRVLSLTDGIEIERPPELLVKWSNIAAICNLSDEQWITLKKPPRKSRAKKKEVGA